MRKLRVTLLGTLTIGLVALSPAAPVGAQDGTFVSWLDAARTFFLPEEEARLERLATMEQARAFMHAFWKRRDPDPSTAANEFRRTFEERLAYVDKEFGEVHRRGCNTPRGQVYLLLGPPTRSGTSFRRYQVEGEFRPVEIWEYAPGEGGRGRLRFVFVSTDEGVKFVVDNPRAGLPSELREEMRRARVALVRAPLEIDEETPAASLPIGARATRAGGAARVRLEIDPRQLMGEPASDGIVFRLSLVRVAAGRRHLLGSIHLPLTLASLREHGNESVRAAAWVPLGPGEELEVVEPLSGRATPVELVPTAAPWSGDPVSRFLAVRRLADDGMIYAYYAASDRHPAIAYLQAAPEGLVTRTLADALAAHAAPLLATRR